MEFLFCRPDHSLLSRFSIACLVLLSISVLSAVDSAAQIGLAWNPKTEPDLAGYRVYYGTPIDVGNVTTCTLNGLIQGATYYVAVTAYDTTRNECGYPKRWDAKPLA
jgi:chitinase